MADKVLDLQLHLNELNELKIHEERNWGEKYKTTHILTCQRQFMQGNS